MEYSLVVDETKDFRYGSIDITEIGVSSKNNKFGTIRLFAKEQTNNHRMVLVLGIPKYLIVKDFLKLIQQFIPKTEYMRELQDSILNRKMLLLKFETEEATKAFYTKFNGKKFSSFEPEICNLAYVNEVFVQSELAEGMAVTTDFNVVDHISNHEVELPSCVVCLERLDSSITGLFTTLCLHTFHCNCIMRWGDSSCPVCRFSSSTKEQNCCASCTQKSDLWICLICGNVGCGRYYNRHAFEHYQSTQHRYSLELESQRVWDYSGDGYVHRIIQNGDGKLVQLPERTISRELVLDENRVGLDIYAQESEVSEQDILLAQKIEAMRSFHHDEGSIIKEQLRKTELQTISVMEGFESKIKELTNYCTRLENQLTMASEELQKMHDESSQLTYKLKLKVKKCQELMKALNDESIINESITKNQALLKSKIQENERTISSQAFEISELKEQVRDLMFFLQTRDKADQIEELAQGTVINVQTTGKSPKKGKGRKK